MSFEYGAMPTEGLLLIEIKPPNKVRNGSRPDLVKLANEMKNSLDKLIDDKLDDPEITVLGVLIEGKLQIPHIYHKRNLRYYHRIPMHLFCNGFTLPRHLQASASLSILHPTGS